MAKKERPRVTSIGRDDYENLEAAEAEVRQHLQKRDNLYDISSTSEMMEINGSRLLSYTIQLTSKAREEIHKRVQFIRQDGRATVDQPITLIPYVPGSLSVEQIHPQEAFSYEAESYSFILPITHFSSGTAITVDVHCGPVHLITEVLTV